MIKYLESEARTNKLYCGDCGKKILKGEKVIFKLSEQTFRMKDVYCFRCKEYYEQKAVEDSEHPFSEAGHGQS